MHTPNKDRRTNIRPSSCTTRGMGPSGGGREAESRRLDGLFRSTCVDPVVYSTHPFYFCPPPSFRLFFICRRPHLLSIIVYIHPRYIGTSKDYSIPPSPMFTPHLYTDILSSLPTSSRRFPPMFSNSTVVLSIISPLLRSLVGAPR